MEHVTYLGSVISNDDTVSKDLENHLSKASSSFGRLSKRICQSHSPASPQRSGYTEQSSFPPSCTVQRPAFSIGSRSIYPSGLTDAACALPLSSDGKTNVKRRSPQDSQPAQHRVNRASGTAALGWPRKKDEGHMHAQSGLLQRAPRRKTRSWRSKKVLRRPAEETACTGRNQPSVMAAGGLRPRQ